MPSLLSLLFLSLSLSLSLSSATNSSPKIQQACKATRFPQQCQSALSQSTNLPPNPLPLQLLQSAIAAASDRIPTAQTMVKSILETSPPNINLTKAATCTEYLAGSKHRISLAAAALPAGRFKDARAWLTAAAGYQFESVNNLKYVSETAANVVEAQSFINDTAILTSNALSMVFSYEAFGNDPASWKLPISERDGFWEKPGSGKGSGPVFPTNLKPDVTVCKAGGSGCTYKTVQEAVNAAPSNGKGKSFVIFIKEGVYEETVRIPLEKTNLVFLGDGMGKTVITGSANAGQPGMTTYNSATVAALGDGFMAKDLTIRNTAGTAQAVALRLDSDYSIVESCEILGHQDTLYPHSLRQFFKSCRVVGTVDFIFGNSAAVFQDCQILVAPRQENPESGEFNTITAHSRSDPAQNTGFVFQNCSVNGTEEYMALYRKNPQVHKTFLGRPWRDYARTIFIHSLLGEIIVPEGWSPWNEAQKTCYYAEFENSGPGSSVSRRVDWSYQVPADHVSLYSAENFIQGPDWTH